jgi:hypothetical protein
MRKRITTCLILLTFSACAWAVEDLVFDDGFEDGPPFRIIGLDTTDNHIADVVDANNNGSLDNVIDIPCGDTHYARIIMEPDTGYGFSFIEAPTGLTVSGGITQYVTNCSDAGLKNPELIAEGETGQSSMIVHYDVLPEPIQISIIGIDLTSDGIVDINNVAGTLETRIEIECGEPFTGELLVDPEGAYAWSDNAPWNDVVDGVITGTPSCNPLDEQLGDSSFNYTATGATSDNVNVLYRVNEAPVQVEIYGVDTDGDGEANITDTTPADSVFDEGIAAICEDGPRITQFLISPEVPGNYNNGILAPNMVFDQETGETIFTPNCGQIGQVYTISYSFTPEQGDTSEPKTLQWTVIP